MPCRQTVGNRILLQFVLIRPYQQVPVSYVIFLYVRQLYGPQQKHDLPTLHQVIVNVNVLAPDESLRNTIAGTL